MAKSLGPMFEDMIRMSRENRPFRGSKDWQFLGLQTFVTLVRTKTVNLVSK